MRICIRLADDWMIEAQSNATQGTLLQNAVAAGYRPEEVDERVVTAAEFAAYLERQKPRQALLEELRAAALREIEDKLLADAMAAPSAGPKVKDYLAAKDSLK